MPGIISSRTRRLYQRPPSGPVCLNRGSSQAQGLVGFWPVQGQPGGIDCSGRMLDLTATGTTSASGPPDGGLALSFNGSSDKLELSSPVVTGTPLTLAAWFSVTGAGADTRVLLTSMDAGGTNGYFLALETDSKVYAYTFGSAFPGAASATSYTTAGEWQHATAVFLASNDRAAYLNGTGKGTNTTASTTGALTTTAIGYGSFGGAWFDSQLAHCCAWDRALSDAEVWSLYDPATRWDLYYPLGSRVWSFDTVAAAATTFQRTVGPRFALAGRGGLAG